MSSPAVPVDPRGLARRIALPQVGTSALATVGFAALLAAAGLGAAPREQCREQDERAPGHPLADFSSHRASVVNPIMISSIHTCERTAVRPSR